MRRVPIEMVDLQQTATYHRRCSLLRSGAREDVIKLLFSTGVGRTTILDIKPAEAEATAPSSQHIGFEVDADRDAGGV